MTAPEAAVVVPVYNAGAYLLPCLDAIASQTLRHFVCILVDDGSTDGSGAVCDGYAARDPRFRAVHQRNGGVSAARAAGTALAKQTGAHWIAFCDGDDAFHPAFLRTLVDAALNTGLPLACCRYESFAGPIPAPGPTAPPRRLMHPEHSKALLHDHAVDYSLCNKLYRADLLTPAALDNGYAYNEDLVTNWQVFRQAPGCAFCDFAGYFYRQHAASASHRPLPPQSVDEQRRAALTVRQTAPADLQADADAFYYEKLVYLASMILRRPGPEVYRPQFHELCVGIRAGLRDPRLGRSPCLPRAIRAAAWATVYCPALWRQACRLLLKDRQ